MLATLADGPLQAPGWVFEPKYDGIRSIAEVSGGGVRLWSRLGNDKTSQFPEIASALAGSVKSLEVPVVLDGEIVALDERGAPVGFQRLQGRIHLTGAGEVKRAAGAQPTAYIVFDLLREAGEDLRALPLSERRARLERRFGPIADPRLRLSEQVRDDGRALRERAGQEGWEGLIAKDARSIYQSGKRSPAWRKLKIVQRQEFIIGGWTEPRQTRSYFGALLLGVRSENGELEYVGHTGTGFDEKELARVYKLLQDREIERSPFAARIKTNEPAHWARPELVAEVRFTEWTDDRKLRHPVYLGLRDDKPAAQVRMETKRSYTPLDPSLQPLIDQLTELEQTRKDGVVELPNGDRIAVTNLWKIYWPQPKVTKGELIRYYAAVSPFLLPVVADRPLVMKRFPNGLTGKPFYQQRSRQEKPPPGVRIEVLPDDIDPIDEPDARRFVGGSLTTLLYMSQIAAISQDPWFSRVQSPLDADYVAIDLDPTEHATFDRVLDVARWVRDELARAGVPGFPKTSGSSGLHIYIPLPPQTSYESGLLLCQIIATLVASRHPKVATVERTVRARPRGSVYVDYLQNILGKTLATAYSARASEFAGVSAPLDWKEIDGSIDPRDFTIRTAVPRFHDKGDLWMRLRTVTPVDLRAVLKKIGG